MKKIIGLCVIAALGAFVIGCDGGGTTGTRVCRGPGETDCIPPTDLATATDTGVATGTPTIPATETSTGVITQPTLTDTGTTDDWPAYCSEDSRAIGLGSGVLITGLWNVTCGDTNWNLYITVSSKGGKTAGGLAFKTAEIDTIGNPDSLTEYKGVAVDNCLWLNPEPLSTSVDKSAPVLKGLTVSWKDPNLKQVTGGDCTMEWRSENQPTSSVWPHYWPGAGE